MNEPDDPITQLAAAAAQVHEIFAAYIEAGFSAEESLYLTAAIVTAGIRRPPQP